VADLARPSVDALVRREATSPWRGSGDLRLEAQQVAELVPNSGATGHQFLVLARNLGTDAEPIRWRGTASDPTRLLVNVVARTGAGLDITTAFLSGEGWTSAALAPGGELSLELVVRLATASGDDPWLDVELASTVDPTRKDTVRITAQADADQDGVSDQWERLWYGGLTAVDGSQDTDADGASSRDEWRGGHSSAGGRVRVASHRGPSVGGRFDGTGMGRGGGSFLPAAARRSRDSWICADGGGRGGRRGRNDALGGFGAAGGTWWNGAVPVAGRPALNRDSDWRLWGFRLIFGRDEFHSIHA
jgi:hypothetical protein